MEELSIFVDISDVIEPNNFLNKWPPLLIGQLI